MVLRCLFTYGYAGLMAIQGVISPGVFTQMIESAGGLDATLGGIVWNVTELFKRCNYAYEYILFEKYPQALSKGSRTVSNGIHRIEFKNVEFSYPGTEKKVLNGINLIIEPGERLSLVDSRTAVYISHRLSSCRLCDHIAVFSEGRVAEYGTHDELVNVAGGLYAKMFEAQAQYYR